MKIILLIIYFFFTTFSKAQSSEEVVFQQNKISNNNIISSLSNKDDFTYLIDSIETNNNFFYSLFDSLTNHQIYPKYSNELDFFFEKISFFSNQPYSYQLNSNLFNNVLFESFNDPVLNEFYTIYLFNSNQIGELCSYQNKLSYEQKRFNTQNAFNIICLLYNDQKSQIELLLEIYNKEEIQKLNTFFLDDYIQGNQLNSELSYDDIGFIDKYILSINSDINIQINEPKSLLDLEIYMKINQFELYQINNFYKNRLINANQYISLLKSLDDQPSELIMYNEITNEINYNKKLQIIEKYLPLLQLDFYDVSRLLNDEFTQMRITNSNLSYMNALMILSLYENSNFLENLIQFINNSSLNNIEDNPIAIALYNYINKDFSQKIYIENIDLINNPSIRFFFLNKNINFDKESNSINIDSKKIKVNPILLSHYAENLDLLNSFIYYINTSENYFNLNEYDLYFINKYLIDDEFLKNEILKLIFKVYLSNT